MGPLAKFLLALTNLVRSGGIKKIPDAIKFAEQQFGKVTPLLKKQIEKVFESAKKPVVGKPGKKEGAVIPMVKEGTKKTEGIETLDEFNLSKDDPMGDFEKIVKGEGDTGLPSQFTNKDIEEAIDNVSPGFVAGDTKYNAELVAEELAVSKGIDYYGLPVKDRAQIYGRAFDGLSKQRMQKADDPTIMDKIQGASKRIDELMKEREAMYKPKPDPKENIMGAIEKLKNPKRPGGPLDPVVGVTRTLARRVLEKRGIEIGKKDPIELFIDTFGEAVTDLKNLGEEIIEADQTGRNLKPMDDLLDIEGFFDMEIPKNPNKGIPNEEMIEMLEKDLEKLENLGAPKLAERSRLKQKYPGIDEELLTNILEDTNPQNKAEVLAQLDDAFEMMRQGKGPDEIIDIFKMLKKTRKDNAEGGLTRTSYAMGSSNPLPEDPTKPVNPFQPKPTGPVLPDKSMMASGYGSYKDFIESTCDEELMNLYIECLNAGDFTKLFEALRRKGYQGRDDIATGGRVQAASGGLAEILKV